MKQCLNIVIMVGIYLGVIVGLPTIVLAEEQMKCEMTVIPEKHTPDNPAYPNGICGEDNLAWGFYVEDTDNYFVQGSTTKISTKSGTIEFELGVAGMTPNPVMVVHFLEPEEKDETNESKEGSNTGSNDDSNNQSKEDTQKNNNNDTNQKSDDKPAEKSNSNESSQEQDNNQESDKKESNKTENEQEENNTTQNDSNKQESNASQSNNDNTSNETNTNQSSNEASNNEADEPNESNNSNYTDKDKEESEAENEEDESNNKEDKVDLTEHNNSNHYKPIRDNVVTNPVEQENDLGSQEKEDEEDSKDNGFFQNIFSYISSFFQSLIFWV